MTTKTKIIIGVAIALILLLFGIVAVIRGWLPDMPKLTTQWTAAPEIKTATKISKNKIPVKGIVVLDKKTAAKKLKIPEAIAKDDNKQITAAAEIPEYEGKTDIAAIFDKNKENIEIIAKQQPLSLFALENRGAIGARWGYSSVASDKTEADIYGSWDVLRIGSTHTGFYGEVTSTGDAKAMIRTEFRWGNGSR